MKEKDLLNAAILATQGKLDPEAAHSIFQINAGKQGLFSKEKQTPVLDKDGNNIISGKRYHNPRIKATVLIIDATFGQGNIMDTYYRVHYYHGVDMKKGFTVVNGKGSPLNGFTYQSDFKLID